jgi:glycosyltransferase involved in cell wall biosynthesis
MKVALFVHCFFPEHYYGTETYTLQIAQNLRALGQEVVVVAAIFQGERRRESLVTRYVYDGVPVIVLDKNFEPHASIRETYWQEAMRPHFRRLLAEIKPDVVHITHLINHTAVLLEEVKNVGIPAVATLTDFFGFCYNNRLEAATGRLCSGPNALRSNCIACHLKAVDAGGDETKPYEKTALRMRLSHALGWRRTANAIVPDLVDRPKMIAAAYKTYDAMVAPTLFLRDAYIRNGFDSTKLRVSRFGVDVDRRPKPRRPSLGPLVVGFVGQIAPHKGVDLLIEAATRMPLGSVRLQIYGPQDQFPSYMERLRRMAGEETSFLGSFAPSRMSEVLAEMDVLAIPSTWYENSPLVLLNALATHTPVLVSDVQGLTEFVTEGVTGWSFRRADRDDLARVLRGLVENPDKVRRASEATQFDRTTRKMAEELVPIYNAVTARTSGVRGGHRS